MGLTFFAAAEDLAEVWGWLFQVPGMKVLEEASAPGEQNRWFEEPQDIAGYLGSGANALAAWPSDVGGQPKARDTLLSHDLQDELGGRARTLLESPALIRVSSVTDQPNCLNPSSISCWTEKGARQRSMYADEELSSVDWPKLKSNVAQLERRIRKHSPGRLHSHPIMPAAYNRLVTGDIELWNWGEAVGYASPYVTPANVR